MATPNAGTSPGDLYAALDELLTFSAAALDLIPTFVETAHLEGAPSLRYITAGLPAVDCCPAMWAYSGQLNEGSTSPGRTPLDPGHRSGSFKRISLPTLNLLVMRCAPGIRVDAGGAIIMPTSDELAASAEQVYADGWCLWQEISRAVRANLLFNRCSEVFMDAGIPQDPAGGCAGWLITMRINLGGYSAS